MKYSFLLFALSILSTFEISAQVSGTVFRDLNANGVKDTAPLERGIGGVTVTTYDAGGAEIATTQTIADGTYTLAGTGDVKIVFTDLPDYDFPTFKGTSSNTSVQFVQGGATDVNLGVFLPEYYCQANPDVMTTCFLASTDVAGINTGVLASVVRFPYDIDGEVNQNNNVNDLEIPFDDVGSIWGIAYDKHRDVMYGSSVYKRFSPYGPNGNGVIYTIDMPTGTVTELIDLNVVFGAGTTGPELHGFASQVDYIEDATTGLNSWSGASKVSFGDIDISDDGKFLFAMNLFDRSVYRIPLDVPATSANITKVQVPLNQDQYPTSDARYVPFSQDDVRPWALKYNKGKLYVGLTATAESLTNTGEQASFTDTDGDGLRDEPSEPFTDLNSNGYFDYKFSEGYLKSYVYELDPTAMTFTADPVFHMNLDDYTPGGNHNGNRLWNPWMTELKYFEFAQVLATYKTPLLTDIEFDPYGSMILGFFDRFGYQGANEAYIGSGAENFVIDSRTDGEILKACPNGANSWMLENNAECGGITGAFPNSGAGPGGGEFFNDVGHAHTETSNGGLLYYMPADEVMMSAYNPTNSVQSQGLSWMSNTNGATLRGYRLIERNATNGNYVAGKGVGIGDAEARCDFAPLEIGNRLWKDVNNNGVQDAGEAGIDGVEIELLKGGSVIATTTTADGGQWYFNDANVTEKLAPITDYVIRVKTALDAGALAGCKAFTIKDATASGVQDMNDSDATPTGEIAYRTANYGQNNHDLDIGLVTEPPVPPCPSPNCGTVTVIKN